MQSLHSNLANEHAPHRRQLQMGMRGYYLQGACKQLKDYKLNAYRICVMMWVMVKTKRRQWYGKFE